MRVQGDRFFLKSIEPFGSGSGLFRACFIRDPDPEVADGVAAGAASYAHRNHEEDVSGPTGSDSHHRGLLYGPDTISLRQEGSPVVGANADGTDDHSEMCTPYIPLDDVALVLSPTAAEVRSDFTL